jgi:hypothetical protein
MFLSQSPKPSIRNERPMLAFSTKDSCTLNIHATCHPSLSKNATFLLLIPMGLSFQSFYSNLTVILQYYAVSLFGEFILSRI